jgi:hypothetical protein
MTRRSQVLPLVETPDCLVVAVGQQLKAADGRSLTADG